jgi:hypothetical protein
MNAHDAWAWTLRLTRRDNVCQAGGFHRRSWRDAAAIADCGRYRRPDMRKGHSDLRFLGAIAQLVEHLLCKYAPSTGAARMLFTRSGAFGAHLYRDKQTVKEIHARAAGRNGRPKVTARAADDLLPGAPGRGSGATRQFSNAVRFVDFYRMVVDCSAGVQLASGVSGGIGALLCSGIDRERRDPHLLHVRARDHAGGTGGLLAIRALAWPPQTTASLEGYS